MGSSVSIGTGFPINYPCAKLIPISVNYSTAASLSTRSATVANRIDLATSWIAFTIKKVIELTLSGLQINALVTHDADAALQAMRSEGPFDAALIVVVLPGELNGRQLADRLKDEYPDIKIAFMSGYTEKAIIHNYGIDEERAFYKSHFLSTN